jgi:predicted RND superfamily exporter protein
MTTAAHRHRLVEFAMDRPRTVFWATGLLTIVFLLALAAVTVDTDPENMLPEDHEVRLRNAALRDDFGAHDLLVVGVIDDGGVVDVDTMTATDELARAAATVPGVIGDEVIWFASGVGDSTELGSQADVDALAATVAADPVLGGNVISSDETALAVFVPLTDKSEASAVNSELTAAIERSDTLSLLQTHVAGLPLAEEEFGRQMFVQMGIFAPLAALLIFGLMWWFFKRIRLVLPAMIVAMVAVLWTMGALIGSGNTLHIMSSMIPIFLMPIAILDSIHVLSEFFDRYPHHLDRRETLRVVYAELYKPLAYTTITTGVAFAALALAPVPPVQVFGVFIAIGVVVAWLLTMLFIPAYVMRLSETKLASALADRPENHDPLMTGLLTRLGGGAVRFRRPLIAGFALLALLAVPAIAQINVNDNPVNWFKSGSSIRSATDELNERLPGTFNANLVLTADRADVLTSTETVVALLALQDELEAVDEVGATASFADLVDPGSDAGVGAQLEAARLDSPLVGTLITSDLDAANVRLQLSDGDNQAMRLVTAAADEALAAHPLPAGIDVEWAGETYLNLVWQEEMVSGMLTAFLSTLLVVLVLMALLFRSVRWALLSMLPVLWTVLVVYGVIGLLGKDFDMPIAVLSTLVLGIGIDFAIHFVQRFRELHDELGDRRWAVRAFFQEPARALTRNALVIAIGFTPLLLASLVPYVVVGVFLSSIIVLSWLTTLVLLPAIVSGTGVDSGPEPADPAASMPERDATTTGL